MNEFIREFEYLRQCRNEWMKSPRIPNTDPDNINIEHHFDNLFWQPEPEPVQVDDLSQHVDMDIDNDVSHTFPAAGFSGADLLTQMDAAASSPSSSSCGTSGGKHQRISYPEKRTTLMRQRAAAVFAGEIRTTLKLQHWPIDQAKLKSNIKHLKFFADRELNRYVRRILRRPQCLSSIRVAIRSMARVYWSDKALAKSKLRLSLSGKRSEDGLARDMVDKDQIPYLPDFHLLFRSLCELSQKDWIDQGHQYRLYQALYFLQRRLCNDDQPSAASGEGSGMMYSPISTGM